MTTRIADNFADIAKRAEEIRAELQANIMGKPLEDPQPTEAPADVDWTGMYGYPSGYVVIASYDMQVTPQELKSLAHPAWPYAGTGHEWRKFVKGND